MSTMRIGEVEGVCKGLQNVLQVFSYMNDGGRTPVLFMWVRMPVGDCMIEGLFEGDTDGTVFFPVDLGKYQHIEFTRSE